MREFDPNDPTGQQERRDAEDDNAARFGVFGMFAVLAVAVLVGLFYWNKNERLASTAMNASPGVTTGASPPPPMIPPGRDSSTRN